MAQGAVPIEQIFDPEFLEELQGLRLVASRVAQGGRYAEQRSRDLGHGLEFRDFRPYAPGDDLRGVDWNIYQRLHRVFLRQFEEFEDLPLYVLPDVSASMFAEDPPRALAGLRATLALAAVSLAQHDSVGLFPFHSKLDLVLKPTTGRTMLMAVARALAELTPGGQTDLAAAVRGLQALRLRDGKRVEKISQEEARRTVERLGFEMPDEVKQVFSGSGKYGQRKIGGQREGRLQ